MKSFFLAFALLLILLAAYPFINQSEKTETVTGLPWQIEILADGSTRVFGLQIGASRLADALDILGREMELAIIAASDEVGRLDMYYGGYRSGLLSGKLILLTDASEQDIKAWRENAIKSDYVSTGRAKKYTLSADDAKRALDEIISGIVFIPAVNLDAETILARFGETSQRIQLEGEIHFLYPEKGIDVTLHDEAKEVIQYVSPNNFQRLSRGLIGGNPVDFEP